VRVVASTKLRSGSRWRVSGVGALLAANCINIRRARAEEFWLCRVNIEANGPKAGPGDCRSEREADITQPDHPSNGSAVDYAPKQVRLRYTGARKFVHDSISKKWFVSLSRASFTGGGTGLEDG